MRSDKECELAISGPVCVYTASLSQVLHDPWDYRSRGPNRDTQTLTCTTNPEEKREGREEVAGDKRSEGGRERWAV